MRFWVVSLTAVFLSGLFILFGAIGARDYLAKVIYDTWYFSGLETESQVSLVSQSSSPSIITFWPPHIDAVPATEWPQMLAVFRQLKDYGFTHIGVRIANPTRDVASKIADLRSIGLPFAYVSNAGHEILTKPDQLDPSTHSSNGKNAKYFDTPGFDPLVCNGSSGCSGRPHVTSHDPAYRGIVWQQELDYLAAGLDKVGFRPGDIGIFDVEIWADPERGVEFYYPRVIQDSTGRYSGSTQERFQQYRNNVRDRVGELVSLIHSRAPNAPVLFYGENPSGTGYYSPSWMESGTGNSPSPAFYWLPDLDKIRNYFSQSNWSRSYPWISFSYSYTTRTSLDWSPTLTKDLGTLLRQEGASGAIVYPGPFDDKSITTKRYLEHARAFMEGFKPASTPITPPPPPPAPPTPIDPPEDEEEEDPVVVEEPEDEDEEEEEESLAPVVPDRAPGLPTPQPTPTKSRQELIIEIILKIIELKKKLLELLLADSR